MPSKHMPFIFRTAAVWSAILLFSAASVSAAGRQFLQGHVPEAVANSKMVGPLPAATQINLAIGLPLRNQTELDSLLNQLVDPTSPEFRHYLNPAQFAERFGPSEEDYQALATFFRADGLSITGQHSNRMILDISGTVAQIESTFHISLMSWSHPTRGTFFAPDREPSLDAGVTILNIAGLDNFVIPRPMDLKAHPLASATPMTSGSGPSGLFNGSDYRAAYAPAVALNGAGQSIGLFELDGFYAADVQANFKQAGLPAVPVQTVLLNGFNGAPGGGNVEVTLDIMMAAYMAPGASKIIVYEGYNPDDVLNRMATDNLASQLSSSWGWSPTDATTEQIFKQFIAQGQSLFQASGDSGAYHAGVMPPSDDPNLTVVGGTSLTTTGPGGAWQSETAWPESGGGVSTTWTIPSYQQSANMAAAGSSSTMRNIPDVALLADVQIFLICNNGQWIEVGGTSAAAPLWAGFLALANQQAAANKTPKIGFLNPPIYALSAGANYQSNLHDIVVGNNGFTALPGFDLATGWGTPTGQSLINALTGTSNSPAFGLSSSAPTLSIAPGANGTSTITVSPQQGFSAAVNLTISGLPVGVTASFSPASALTTSTLAVMATSSAAATTSTLTITGTSGSLTSTARISLTIAASSSFTLSATPASLNLAPGGVITSTIAVNPQGGFQGTVALAALGLPAGVTATFNLSSTTRTTTLTFYAAANVAPGTSTITVTGTSGTITSKAQVAVTISTPASFTLSATPASLSLAPGANGGSTIAVTAQNGFNATVVLAASGLPAGVTAIFSTMTAARTSIVTFTATSAAAAATATVTITGTSGTLTGKTSIALTIAKLPAFTLSISPAVLSIAAAGTGTSTLTLTPQNGFSGSVLLSLSGLPSGVTPTFTAGLTSSTAVLTLAVSASTAAVVSTVTITGKSGTLSVPVTIALTIQPPSTANGSVNLAAAYNVTGMVTDGAQFLSSSSLDGGGRAYSGNLLATVRTAAGATYNFGPSNAPGAVTGGTIGLPSGKFSALTVLAAGVNGGQIAQTFTVTYTDGTTASFKQSLSDWCTPQNFVGESNAISMPYRDNSTGTRDTRTVMLYAYTFTLSNTKTVKSVTLPTNRNVVVLAMALNPATTSTAHVVGSQSGNTFVLSPAAR
jgi:hypothetical protein